MIKEYLDWHSKYGDDHKSVGWNKPKHRLRFKALISFWDKLIKADIIDLGCGLAHMAKFLEKKKPNFKYTGIDINDRFIYLNKSKYPQHKFFKSEADNFSHKADLIIASGLFNRRFNDSEEFFFKTIHLMIFNSKIGCSFNCLSSKAIKKNEHNFYVNLNDIEKIIDRSVVDGFNVDGDSLPGELTVHIRKKIV
jgi:SAM-dependent methyltransferase